MELFFCNRCCRFIPCQKPCRCTAFFELHHHANGISVQYIFLYRKLPGFLGNLSLHCRFPRQVIWSEASLQERDLQCRELRYLWHIWLFYSDCISGLSIKRKTCKKRTGNSRSKYSEERTVSSPKLRFLLRTCASLLPVAQTRLTAQTVAWWQQLACSFLRKPRWRRLTCPFSELTAEITIFSR